MLSLAEYWLWDSWIADDGDLFHMWVLRAPRSLGHGWSRHKHAKLAHATSKDLREWTYHGLAFDVPDGGFDDLAQWTGCTVRGDDGVWRMFYTGVGKRNGVIDQRIGLQESEDLFTWRRVGDGPVVSADPRWYKTSGVDGDPYASETWRDPFVFRDPGGDGWHMYTSARGLDALPLNDGVIGHARSHDLLHWEVQPPACEPAGFGEVEVAQTAVIDGQPTLVFTCGTYQQDPQVKQKWGEFCTYSIPGDSLLGPWDLRRAVPFEAEPDLFAAPLVRDRTGEWVLVGFVNLEPKGILSFDIIDPIPLVSKDGVLAARADYVPVGAARLATGR